MQTGSRAQNADGEPSPECRGGTEPRMQIRCRAQNADGEPSPECRGGGERVLRPTQEPKQDRKSTRLNSSHVAISYAVFCLKKKTKASRRTKEMRSTAEEE